MTGDSQRRFCDHCQLHVHNLSAMSDRQRELFVSQTGGHACIAYELRADGSMVTPSRWVWLTSPVRNVTWRVIAILAALLPFLFSSCATRRTLGRVAHTCDPQQAHTADRSHQHMVVGTPLPPKHLKQERNGQ